MSSFVFEEGAYGEWDDYDESSGNGSFGSEPICVGETALPAAGDARPSLPDRANPFPPDFIDASFDFGGELLGVLGGLRGRPDAAFLLGHGRWHLATVFAHLIMLAFLIDQVQQRRCSLFRAARAKAGSLPRLWRKLRGLFLGFHIPDWETLYQGIAFGRRKPDLEPFDTS